MSTQRFVSSRSALLRATVTGFALCTLSFAACGGSEGGGASEPEAASSSSGGERRASGGKQSGKSVSKRAHAQWAEALKLYKSYDPKDWTESHCDEVTGKFEAAASNQAKFTEALYMAGLAQEKCAKREKAQSFYDQALRANPKFCKARVAVGLGMLAKGEAQQAEREFGQSVADDPQCTEGYVNLAILQRKRGQSGNTEALANLRRALAIDAQYLPAFNEMALLYLSEAAENEKKLDLAEVVCSQAQQINANYAPVFNTWGLVDLRRGKIIDAAAKFQRASELDDRIFEAHMNFARITIGFRGYQDAKTAYEHALTLQPNNFEAQLGLGVALRGLQDNAKAQEAYEKATKLQPSRPEPYYNLGVLFQDFQSGTPEEMKKAEGYYREFLSRAGGDKRYANVVEEIQRKCKIEGKRKQGKNACVAGRLQNISVYIDTMKQMQEMEKMQKEQEKQAAEAEAAEKKAADPGAAK